MLQLAWEEWETGQRNDWNCNFHLVLRAKYLNRIQVYGGSWQRSFRLKNSEKIKITEQQENWVDTCMLPESIP